LPWVDKGTAGNPYMQIQEYIKKVQNKEISPVKTIKAILKEAKETNKEYRYFNTFSEELALELAEAQEKQPKGKLAGLPVSIKDCICVKGVESTAGSYILKGYKPFFNATVIDKLIQEGAIIIGKTSQDEFGFGSFNTNISIDRLPPKNPIDKNRVTGGSSGGSAGFTAITQHPHVSIAESTGGSISSPSSFCGVSGLTPTYGLISRYGLIDYANSLDKIGIMAKSSLEIQPILDVIKGNDKKDSTSLTQDISKNKEVKKIAIIKESLNIDKEVKSIILESLKEKNIKYELISLPLTEKYSLATYYIIAMSEASTNLAKYSGIRYGLQEELKGNFDEYFSKIRSKAFNKESKRRIILGTFARMSGFRDQYYLKAMKVRTLIIEEYKNAFKKYDLLLSPTMPIIAPKFSEVNKLTPMQNYMMDILTVGPNLAGLPHLSVNIGFQKKMPIGLQIISNHLNENKLFTIGEKIEDN